MLKHFTNISGTGKFLSYKATTAQTPDFDRLNLLYGENGSGKTTLSLIFRSLRGDDELLLKKRSFNHSVPQYIALETDRMPRPEYVFSDGKWDAHLPGIEVFDVHFINENIYTGLEIQNTHRKNLFEVILGEQGIQLKTEIQVLKERLMKGGKITREATRDIEAAIDNAFTAREFAEQKALPDIADRIAEKEHELETARHQQDIIEKAFLSEIPTLNLPFDWAEAEAMLATSIDNISDDYLHKFKTHKDSLDMGGRGEEWIKQGYAAIHDDNCPFCQRPFDNSVEILEAYRQYFNDAYNQLISGLANLIGQLERYNPEARLFEMENTLSANRVLIDFWKKYLTNPPDMPSLLDHKAELMTAFTELKNCFKIKANNPVKAMDAAALSTYKAIVEALNEKVNKLNASIVFYNGNISLMKEFEGAGLPQLELEWKQLSALEKRDDPHLAALCKNLITYEDALVILKQKKDEKQAELDGFKNVVFDQYLAAINRHLKAFAPYIELKQLTSTYMGNSTEPSVKFALSVEGNTLLQKDDPELPTLKYSLSEGDKNAMALAFFLTKLELDPMLSDKIIVFDDPVSHFDEKRRATLLGHVLRLGQKARQVFLLTHDLGVVEAVRGQGMNGGIFRIKEGGIYGY